jgi:hypothetical protein
MRATFPCNAIFLDFIVLILFDEQNSSLCGVLNHPALPAWQAQTYFSLHPPASREIKFDTHKSKLIYFKPDLRIFK